MTAWILRLGQQDERFLHAVVLRRRPFADRLMRALTHLGDAPVAIGLVVLLMLGVFPELTGVGREAAFTLVLSHALVQLFKRTISRPRPRMPVGVASLVRAPDRFSFPSGHSAAAFSVALPLALHAPLLAAPLLLLAALVAASRCYLGVHYPGDALAGVVLALIAAVAAEPVLEWTALLVMA